MKKQEKKLELSKSTIRSLGVRTHLQTGRVNPSAACQPSDSITICGGCYTNVCFPTSVCHVSAAC